MDPKEIKQASVSAEGHTFGFEEGRTRPVRSCGTTWITHKLNAMKLVVDNLGCIWSTYKRFRLIPTTIPR